MIKDRRPYYLKRFYFRLQEWYANHFIRPHLSFLGDGCHFIRPWHVSIFGTPISIGRYTHVICASDSNIRLVIWSKDDSGGSIDIGDYCLISPGVRITSASRIEIGNNCMLANGAFVTDADWHGIYDRLESIGNSAPVILKENVWIGDSATVCKGVTIGENSIIGAGAVVTTDIPANCIAAGNPAKVIRELDSRKGFTKREKMFANPEQLNRYMNEFDKGFLKSNSTLGWLRTLLFPRKGD
ncbi:MAG: acyltransferase [Deltaproteobacteria bacterium]|nr:acyltransferase [Deltaproteobacteria bacterium]MBT4640140.1 acyltransferase [Deltaproteobacteria bacterium]MBT6499634.1 acyltransferase [Deltaproteobacteria bacterium]MBT6611945.1 acyltransferase [Deltaproteobacteria bacterium]MBT7153594.1 acyltransferase [Deltaproteobacteria bacterium]